MTLLICYKYLFLFAGWRIQTLRHLQKKTCLQTAQKVFCLTYWPQDGSYCLDGLPSTATRGSKLTTMSTLKTGRRGCGSIYFFVLFCLFFSVFPTFSGGLRWSWESIRWLPRYFGGYHLPIYCNLHMQSKPSPGGRGQSDMSGQWTMEWNQTCLSRYKFSFLLCSKFVNRNLSREKYFTCVHDCFTRKWLALYYPIRRTRGEKIWLFSCGCNSFDTSLIKC